MPQRAKKERQKKKGKKRQKQSTPKLAYNLVRNSHVKEIADQAREGEEWEISIW